MRNSRGTPRSMPGDVHPGHSGMQRYIVALKDASEENPRGLPRGQAYDAGVARVADFQRRLKKVLEDRGLSDHVAEITPPGATPVIGLVTTPAVAKVIESLPEVEVVTPDFDDMRIVR